VPCDTVKHDLAKKRISQMKTGRGGKLNKSEAVQVRFDPILKMAAELAAGKERRTLSSFVEWAVEQAVKRTLVARDEAGNPISAFQVANECWHHEDSRRLYVLAKCYSDLLTIRERKISEAINWTDQFVKGLGDDADFVKFILISRAWDYFCRYADDHLSLEDVIIGLRNARALMDKDGTLTDADPVIDLDLSKKESP
jgi:hypothetical protein